MKILWIVNSVLNDLSVHLYGKGSNGVWMDALLGDFKERGEHTLCIATVLPVKERVRYEKDGVVYYALPNAYPLLYKENNKKNQNEWKRLLEEEKPDLIQVWGTEFTHGLCALRLAKGIPSVVYMQGYLGSIARYYQAGIDYKTLKKSRTFRDVLKKDSILQQQKKYVKSAVKEKETLRLSGNIISENEWCNANIRAIVPEIRVHDCALSINKVFAEKKWSLDNVERHSIMCTASGYTIKGLHMVFRAAALLKEKYPDLKVYVPGTKMVGGTSFKGKLRKNGYTKYIEKLIKELDIEKHVVWLGRMPQEALAEQYKKSHVFMMSSAIENHSSSLKEAMMVGVPCVSSAVGGIPEYVRHGENGYLYRFEEYAVAAKYIEDIFENDELAEQLSQNARADMLKLHEGADLYEKIICIYQNVLEEK